MSGDATVPFEAFDDTHPDHEEWVRKSRRCMALMCPSHNVEQLVDLTDRIEDLAGEFNKRGHERPGRAGDAYLSAEALVRQLLTRPTSPESTAP